MNERDDEKLKKAIKKKSRTANRALAKQVWTFLKNTLEEAIKIPKAIEEQNAGNPMKADMLVKAIGFLKPNDWRFLDILKSAN
ncbi:hypothetical protein IIA95_03735 [Patescibacteria group bacterium]|nr:hypothetical protein [Patescibacteria group bacterium]